MDIFLLTTNPDEFIFISRVSENDIGEVFVETTSLINEAIVFMSEEDALSFKKDWRLRAWLVKIKKER